MRIQSIDQPFPQSSWFEPAVAQRAHEHIAAVAMTLPDMQLRRRAAYLLPSQNLRGQPFPFQAGLLGQLSDDLVVVRVTRVGPWDLGDILPPLLHKWSNRGDPLASFFRVLHPAGRLHPVSDFYAVQLYQGNVLPDLIAAVAFE